MSNALSKIHLRFIFSHTLFLFGRELFNIFFAVFIWEHTESLALVGTYYILHILGHILSFTAWAPLVKKGKAHLSRGISLLSQSLIYVYIFSLGVSATEHLILLGLCVGLANGTYWISYNVLSFDITHMGNRGNYAGVVTATKTGARLLAPILGGILIHVNLFGLHYGNIFLLGSVAYLSAFFVGNIPIPHIPSPPLHLIKTAKRIRQEKNIRQFFMARFFGNFAYRGVMERLLPIFLFNVLQNEFQLGTWFSLFSLIAVVSTLFVGKYLPYTHYRTALLFGASCFFIATISLIGMPLLFTYVLYGFTREILLPFVEIPLSVYRDNIFHTLKDYQTHRVEYMVLREWIYVFSSRILAYSMLLFVPSLSGGGLQAVLAIMSCGILLELFFARRIRINTPTT